MYFINTVCVCGLIDLYGAVYVERKTRWPKTADSTYENWPNNCADGCADEDRQQPRDKERAGTVVGELRVG